MKSKELKERINAGAPVCIPVPYFQRGKRLFKYIQLDPKELLNEIRRSPNREWHVEPMNPSAQMDWTVWFYGIDWMMPYEQD